VARTLVSQFPEKAETEPEVVARHYEAAGLVEEAITYYERAGARAQARSAHEEAIRHFRQAIALLGTQPEGVERNMREVPLELALGGSLIAVRGYTHAETEDAYERACCVRAWPITSGSVLRSLAWRSSARTAGTSSGPGR
jgi:predicted ATPase